MNKTTNKIKVYIISCALLFSTVNGFSDSIGPKSKKDDKSSIKSEIINKNKANKEVKEIKPPRSRKKLKKAYIEHLAQIDSLQLIVDEISEKAYKYDSLQADMMNIIDENESMSAAGLNPEDYSPEVTDSLLNMWYLHKQLEKDCDNDTSYNMDSVKFQSNVPDSVYIRRLEDMNSYINIPFNQTVKNFIILYSEKMPTKMSRILALCDFYMPYFEETFNKYNIPEELKIMAIIESAMNPKAVSYVGAKGMWQFMYSTAKNYGLKIDSFVDERLDPIKSADAAARYLLDSYKIFGDWNLAISSYNCGAGNVNRAIRRSGGKRDFWSIYPYLPKETRGYVPAFVGAMYALTYQKEHNLAKEDMQLPAHVDTFKINKMLHFKQINELVGVPMDVLKNLNPQYTHDIIPGNSKNDYILRVPFKYTGSFIDHEDSLYTYKADKYFSKIELNKIKRGGYSGGRTVYRVRNGDYLGRIARRHHVSVNQIKRWNNLRSNNIRVGQRLTIYGRNYKPSTSNSKSSSKKSTKYNSKKSVTGNAAQKFTRTQTVYTVRNGESLYMIAKKFPGISAANIMSYNNISSNIKPGMKLKIPARN